MSVQVSYARALYETAFEQGVSSDGLNQIEKQLDTLQHYLDHSKEAQAALFGPVTGLKEKLELLDVIGSELKFSPLLAQFVAVLAKKGRLVLLGKIRDMFLGVRLAAEGGLPGRLVSAEPIDEESVGFLAKAFSQKLGKKVAFRVTVDPLLLAGIKITVNGVTYDGTLRSQIQKLRDQFAAGVPGSHA